jgi:hypothetical protein
MSTTTTIVICVVTLLLGGLLNFYAHKTWILYLPLAGILLGLGYAGHLWIRSFAAPFSVTREIALAGVERNSCLYWLVHRYVDEVVASPITDLMYVRFTNLDSSPLLVDYYAVDVREKGKEWRPAKSLDHVRGQIFTVTKEGGPADAVKTTLTDPKFNEVITNKNIGRGESVRGVLIIERPEGLDQPIETEWRMRIRDAKGKKSAAVMAEPTSYGINQSLVKLGLSMDEHVDIRGIRLVFYSELARK